MRMMPAAKLARWLPALVLLSGGAANGQAIEFESNGLKYLTLTRGGLTIMFAELPVRVRNFAVIQVAVSNGSDSNRTIKPEDFLITPETGAAVRATPARYVVEEFLGRAGRNDVIKLVSLYEAGLYGLSRFQSTNGYEQRRQNALAELTSSKLKAAATASAVALVQTRLKPGQTTDGAVFFPLANRPLSPGKLVAQVGVESFEFTLDALKHPGELVKRP